MKLMRLDDLVAGINWIGIETNASLILPDQNARVAMGGTLYSYGDLIERFGKLKVPVMPDEPTVTKAAQNAGQGATGSKGRPCWMWF